MPLGRPGRDLTEEWEVKKQPFLRKDLIDDMTDFHGFITPGSKFSSQRLEDECSTALPSQCTSAGSLESLPTTPAGFGTQLPTPMPGPVQGWQPGLQSPFEDETHIGDSWDIGDELASFLYAQPGIVQSVSSCDQSALESSLLHLASASPMISPPSTPRQERTADRTCPLAPAQMPNPMPALVAALRKNNLDEVSQALEADPESARLPFWDHNVEPPLCTAIRLGCKLDVVKVLLKFGADVKAKDSAGQSPLAVLTQNTWYTAPVSKEIEEVLLSAGAEPPEKASKSLPEKKMMYDMFQWNSDANAGSLGCNLYDFGLPPSLGFMPDFDAPFDIKPPSL